MADSLIYDLCKAAGKELLKKASLLHGVPEEAKKMEQNLENIKAVLKAAEQREIEADVKTWLSELRNVAYDIEDVLEDYSIADSRYVWTKQLKSDYNIAQRIKSINEKLGEIDERKNRFNFRTSINSINERPKLEPAPAYGDYTVVRSHEEVKAKVIQMLVPGDSKGNVANGNRIPLISLVGMGGIGKTTLARLVYNDGSVKGHFSKTIWVSVLKPFNEMNVAKAIAEGLNLDSRNNSTEQNVLSKIDGSIKGLKFLLVLDDVWEDSKGKWGGILRCLGKGNTQSRILLTTRNSELSEKMGADIVSVEGLPVGDAWSLFSYYAFPGESGHRKEVKDIAERLAEKCRGLPLALKVLGIHMASKKTRTEWDNVLTSELWKTEFEESVFYSLAVSYLELPSAAKTCFAFCSIFPKDTVMTKNNLIRLWMAQGYLRGEKGDQMEDLGEVCFQSLESRSFFRVREIGYAKFADKEVTMHDLVHDFARYISNGEVAILDPSLQILGGGVISKNLRHLAISGKARESNCPYSTFGFNNALHTLFVSTDSIAVLEAVCRNISYVRALDIQIYFEAAECPSVDYHFKDIGKLEHLRYLGLRTNISTVLPKRICELPYLQTLHIKSLFSTIKTFPNNIGKLTSLRHLLFDVWDCSLPKGLGKLSSLQTLSYFPCSAIGNDGCSIEDLRDLNNLRGELRLEQLNNVANADEATRAELLNKTRIRKLSFEFGDGDASLQSKVLEALVPAGKSLEILTISLYRGRECPPWMGNMRYLKVVSLEHVSVESLPGMGMLCHLEKLFIWGAHKVRCVGAEFYGKVEPAEGFFPKLTDLEFTEMSRWKHWEGPNVRKGSTIMPSLCSLSVRGCDALRTFPRFLRHVRREGSSLYFKRLPN